MRRKIVISALLLVVVLGGLFLQYVVMPGLAMRRIGQAYRQSVRGMTKSEVLQLMEGCEAYRREREFVPIGVFWDDEPLGDAVSVQAKSWVWYTVGTFYLPVSYTFFFDEQDRLLGRHRFD